MELVKVCFLVSKDILSLKFNSVSSSGSAARELLAKVHTEMEKSRPDWSKYAWERKEVMRDCLLLARL